MIDAVACEPQFVDHLAPVWRALPETVRGRFRVDDRLADRATVAGVSPDTFDATVVRTSSRAPDARPGDGPTAFVASIGDTKVARRMGYRRFLFIEHGAGQSYLGGPNAFAHPSYAGGGDREDFSLFLVPNLRSAADWLRAYPSADVRVVGCPKLDGLPRREPGPGPVVAISFHWPGFVAPEADTALGFYISSLRDLAARYRVIGHAHPKSDWPVRMARVYERAGIEFVAEFDDVCRRADVYVCDNSSTIFEFAATGRPVVLLNSPHYRRNVEHGLRFWEAAGVGVQVDRASDLFDGIDRALADAPADAARRDLSLGIVYAVRSDAARVAADAIVDHLARAEAA
jgi:hypothetical protein